MFKIRSHFLKMQNLQQLSFVLRQLHSSWVQRTTTTTTTTSASAAAAAASATTTTTAVYRPYFHDNLGYLCNLEL